MTDVTLQKYFADDPPSLFDNLNGKISNPGSQGCSHNASNCA